jgi:DNA invertase Pin-like site-specific DNA recombinase
MNKTKQAIAYIRVSTRGQGEHGNGLDLQITRIEAYAREAGYELVTTFRDVQSGAGEDSTQNRPGIREAISFSQKTGFPIIVDGLDRFARNTKKLEELVLSGKLRVISAMTGEGAPRAVMIGEAARAQAERDLISQTTKEALQRKRREGVILGNTKNLDEAQQKGAASNKAKADQQTRELAPVVKEICAPGKVTKEAIANELNRLGHRTARGGLWDKDKVRRLLDRIAELEKQQEIERQKEQYRDNPQWGIF